MTVQIRPRDCPNAPAYAPDRDIAHLFPRLVRVAAEMLPEDVVADGAWPWRACGTPDPAKLEAAAEAYFGFVRSAYLDPKTDVEQLLAGFRDGKADEFAMTVLLASVGLAATSAYMVGVRRACSSVQEAEMSAREISDASVAIRRLANPTRGERLRRACHRLLTRWRGMFGRAKSKEPK